MKKFVIVEWWESTEKTIVEANTKKEAIKKLRKDDEHNGDIIDCYEVK
jgi:hypothetical protein